MILIIGIVLFVLFVFLASLHFYWSLGGKWGSDSAIPTKENQRVINPGFADCFAVGLGLLATGVFILIKVKLVDLPLWNWLASYGLWIISAVFMARAIGEFKYVGFFKKEKNTKFARSDTKYFSPLCLIISILMIIIQLNN
jgi:hypothetical protein